VSLKGVHKLIQLNRPMLDESTFCANKEIRLVNLVHICRSPLILESLDDVLSSCLKVNDSKDYLRLIVV